MLNVELYIGNDRLDLFDDEKIALNMTIKNLQNIDKVFTDFTQSFNIPASAQNNKVMQHWYSYDVVTSFVPQTVRAGRIEINGIHFRSGNFRLESAKVKNSKVDSYQISFFGDLINLSDYSKMTLWLI